MQHMPIRIEFIDSAERVDELLPALYEMVEDGVIDVQETNVVKAAVKGQPAPRAPHAEIKGPAKLIRIYMEESDRIKGDPLFDIIVKKLMMMEVAGATVYRGIFGYGAKGHIHQEGLLRSHDCPVVISVVEKPERVDEIIQAIAPMMQDGLIVISDVEVHRFVHALPGNTGTNASTTTS